MSSGMIKTLNRLDICLAIRHECPMVMAGPKEGLWG